ncbi:hypothetical protein H2200_009531 [Cladophialophora chaetospira]|uniref:non-specific serine/threonine protein kinase n=1 Tax=Cladophialophora chaetospira TaxID=386627 RepID=A0AA38X2R1_9EURO|nr:hypothetical protein H2200_009531 [Cladophialophora chaetospira]
MSNNNLTPAHQPTYGVQVTPEQIRQIIEVVFPGHQVTNIVQLESGKSFNNRIYFINVEPSRTFSARETVPLHLVLKVCGRGFHSSKIENELGSLFLLHKYCPDLPIPRIFAWSGDGKSVETTYGASTIYAGCEEIQLSEHAWILMERLPGRSMTVDDLDGPHREVLLHQVAGCVSMWRTLIPATTYFGNLRRLDKEVSSESTNVFLELADGEPFCIGGLLLCTYYDPAAMTSPLEYYGRSARDQVEKLAKSHLLAGIKDEVYHIVEDFLSIMPSIPILQNRKPSSFTHFDLSPRNILISETDPPQITGFLDFEFAGFFPEEEEFLNAQVRQTDDWRQQDWKVLMRNLGSLGQVVPPTEGVDRETCISESHWNQLNAVAQITDNIAPWYIQEGAFSAEDLAVECQKAAAIVREKMRELQELVTGDHG